MPVRDWDFDESLVRLVRYVRLPYDLLLETTWHNLRVLSISSSIGLYAAMSRTIVFLLCLVFDWPLVKNAMSL